MNINRMRELAGLPLMEAASAVPSKNGFKKDDRVTVQDVQSKPPQTYKGTIVVVYDDGTCKIDWDSPINRDAENHLVSNGVIDLHNVSKA